jgi:hypothetical protein
MTRSKKVKEKREARLVEAVSGGSEDKARQGWRGKSLITLGPVQSGWLAGRGSSWLPPLLPIPIMEFDLSLSRQKRSGGSVTSGDWVR